MIYLQDISYYIHRKNHVFSIEPKNTIAKKIFKLYDKYFWSNNVRQEFEHRFDQKQTTLSSFFNDLKHNVEKSNTPYLQNVK